MNEFSKQVTASTMTMFGAYLYIGVSPQIEGLWYFGVAIGGVIMSLSGIEWKISLGIRAHERRKALAGR